VYHHALSVTDVQFPANGVLTSPVYIYCSLSKDLFGARLRISDDLVAPYRRLVGVRCSSLRRTITPDTLLDQCGNARGSSTRRCVRTQRCGRTFGKSIVRTGAVKCYDNTQGTSQSVRASSGVPFADLQPSRRPTKRVGTIQPHAIEKGDSKHLACPSYSALELSDVAMPAHRCGGTMTPGRAERGPPRLS